MRDLVEQRETLARVRMAGSSGAAIVIGLLAVGALLRTAFQVALPSTVLAVGVVLAASDLWLAHLPPQQSQRRLDRINFLHHLLDICGITFVLQQLGAAEWGGAYLYLFVVLHANIAYRRLGALVVTSLCVVAFVSLVMADYWGLSPPAALFPQREALLRDPSYVATMLLWVAVGGLLLFSLNVGAFADMLRGKQDELHTANTRLQEAAERLRGRSDELELAVERRTQALEIALQQLRTAHAELTRVDELKTSFLANVSHELRTPLTSIRSFAEILLKYPDEESDNRREFLQIIAIETDRLSRLIEDVLDIARIESGHVQWNFSSVEMSSLLSFCVRSVAPLAREKGLALHLNVPADLAPVRADRDRIAQVLNNLLGNALKFTERGVIAVAAAREGDYVRVCVQDTGPGIPDSERAHVFEKFHQIGDGLTAKPRGTGLGLAICAEIVAHHGGTIRVDGPPGGGSAFSFALPVDGAQPESASAPLVLVVASDPAVRQQHRRALEQAAYQVQEAQDAAEATRLLQSCPVDLVYVDAEPADLRGFDLLRALPTGSNARQVPVIVACGMEHREWALRLGAACHLAKPLGDGELAAAVAQALGARARAAATAPAETSRA
jgi:signal transduction histidine kinase/ActR/RegA family two-component response regulator